MLSELFANPGAVVAQANAGYAGNLEKPLVFTPQQLSILKQVWWLKPDHLRLLDRSPILTQCSVKHFTSLVQPETYPVSYEDKLQVETMTFYVSYIQTSASYLDELAVDKPEAKLLLQLRWSVKSNFFYCLVVRREFIRTSHYQLVKQGMRVIQE